MIEKEICPFMIAAPVWLRPWIWLQLFFLRRWVEHHQRAVFLVMEAGSYIIRVRYFGDVAKPANAYTYNAPPVPAWDRAQPHAHLFQSVISEPAKQISGTRLNLTLKRLRCPSNIWDPWRSNASAQSELYSVSHQALRTPVL